MPAPRPHTHPPVPPAGDDATASVATWRAAIEALPVATRADLAHLFSPSAINQAARAERHLLIGQLAEGQTGDLIAIAGTIHRRLSRYAAGAWRYDQNRAAPADHRNLVAYNALRSSGGKILSIRTLRRLLGDPTVATKTQRNGHALLSRSYGQRRSLRHEQEPQ